MACLTHVATHTMVAGSLVLRVFPPESLEMRLGSRMSLCTSFITQEGKEEGGSGFRLTLH